MFFIKIHLLSQLRSIYLCTPNTKGVAGKGFQEIRLKILDKNSLGNSKTRVTFASPIRKRVEFQQKMSPSTHKAPSTGRQYTFFE